MVQPSPQILASEGKASSQPSLSRPTRPTCEWQSLQVQQGAGSEANSASSAAFSCGPLLHTTCPGFLVQTTCPGFLVQTTSPGFLVQTTCPGFFVQTTCPGFFVQTTCPGFFVQSTCPGFLVQTISPGFLVQTTSPGFLVQSSTSLETDNSVSNPISTTSDWPGKRSVRQKDTRGQQTVQVRHLRLAPGYCYVT